MFDAIKIEDFELGKESGGVTLLSSNILQKVDEIVDYKWTRESANALIKWLSDNDISYYARPHELFSEGEAWEIAKEMKAVYLVMENLS